MTNEINAILSGSTTSYSGWGIAYTPSYENATGLTESYSVGFFSRHTQTFYEPYLLTTYNDLIKDDRNNFVKNRINKLYLYVTDEDSYSNLDNNPIVNIFDNDGVVVGFVGHLCFSLLFVFVVVGFVVVCCWGVSFIILWVYQLYDCVRSFAF